MLKTVNLVFASFLLQLQFGSATLYASLSNLPKTTYDFVIIGGGTAGNVIANRLTENSSVAVLLLEAGGSNEGAIETEVPFFAGLEVPHRFDWNFTTVPQLGLGGRSASFPRGFILGGSSSINAMFYTRGSVDDWNRFAEITGDSGWSWSGIQRYLAKNERWTAPADLHNTTGQFDPAFHSFTGINAVSLSGFPQSIDEMVIQASHELGGIFKFNLDYNSGYPLGLGWKQSTIDGANRSSSATSYLAPEFLSRPNLHVLLNTRVSRVLPSNTDSDSLVFRTVELAQDLAGPFIRVNASKEVILSAGSIGTPQILLNSGIGNSSYLTSIGIQPLVDLPSVGQNLSDQPLCTNAWFVNSTKTVDTIIRNDTLFARLFEEWSVNETGLFVDAPGTQLIFGRLNDTILDMFDVDPAAGKNTPHFELGIGSGMTFTTPPTGNFISLSGVVVSPVSRGSVTLNTSVPGPFSPPLIDPAYYSSLFDLRAMREAIKAAFTFLAAPAWDGYVLGPYTDLANATTDELLDEYIKMKSGTSAHPVGTAAMSNRNASYGVVHPDLLVKGVQGLRIADASVLPFVTSAHTQAPVYVVAEHAAELIKKYWGI